MTISVHAIKAVIFDIGRVLVAIDTPGEKLRRLMLAAGVRPDGAPDDVPFLAEARRHMRGEIPPRELHRLAAERFNLPHGYDEFAEAWCDRFQPLPGMEALFREVASRRRVGLLSDTDPLHWPALLGLMPWLAEVERPTLSFLVGRLKPDREMYVAGAANVGAAPGECLFVDDLPVNVEGARRCGMAALRFEGAERLREDLRGLGVL